MAEKPLKRIDPQLVFVIQQKQAEKGISFTKASKELSADYIRLREMQLKGMKFR